MASPPQQQQQYQGVRGPLGFPGDLIGRECEKKGEGEGGEENGENGGSVEGHGGVVNMSFIWQRITFRIGREDVSNISDITMLCSF